MKKNRITQLGILTVLTVFLVVGTAGGAVYYSDNLDNVAAGDDPIAQVGTWTAASGGQANAGTGLATAPSTPNYLDNDRKGDVFAEAGYSGDFVGSPLGVGSVIHAEQMVYQMTDLGGGYPSFGLNVSANNLYPWDPTSGDAIMGVCGNPTGSTVYTLKSNGGLIATGLTHLVNTWQKWEIDYVVGASSFKLTVGGNSVVLSGTNGMKNPAATQCGAVWINAFSGSTHSLHDNISVGSGGPDPVCGDAEHPYPAGDLDLNCLVNFKDFAMFAANWLECTDPSCD